jgi:hypothetical protein
MPSTAGGGGGKDDLRTVAVVPRPSEETLPLAGGGLSSSGGTGAYSSTVVGLDWGRFSDDGRSMTATTMARARRARGG